MTLSERLEAARARGAQMLRDHKARVAERKAAKQAAMLRDQHAHSRFWLLNVPAFSTICAAVVEWYWAVLFCLAATGRLTVDWATAVGSDASPAGAWHFALNIENVAVLVGLVLATMPIVMLSMVWLPVQFVMRGAGRWRRGTLITVGILANILVIVSGTVVMNYNRQGQVRESLVVEQTAQQGRAAIDARLAFEQEQLRLALANANPYLNQAANVGAAEWERSYVAQARATNDPRLPMLERALGAARAADQRRANIEALTIQRAQAAPEAASAAHVEDNVGAEMNWFAQRVEVYRPPFVAFICTLIGIFGAWWTLAMLEHLNPRDVLRSGWADEGHRIEDLRGEEVIDSQGRPKSVEPMVPPREDIYDAETGDRLIRVKGAREHLRRAGGKKGKPQKIHIEPEIPPDETGVPPEMDNRDSELRAGHEFSQNPNETITNSPSKENYTPVTTVTASDEQDEISEEALASLNALTEEADEIGAEGETQSANGEQGDSERQAVSEIEDGARADGAAQQDDTGHDDGGDDAGQAEITQQEEPQSRETRMLPAPESVAAE